MTAALGVARYARAGAFDVSDGTWEGYSGLFELAKTELGPDRVIALGELDWSDLKPEDALLLIHPDHAISAEKLAGFLGAGGRIAVLDDFGAGDKILERFQIERVPAPSRPLATLRRNPDLAIAEPVSEPMAGHAAGIHATVENVERLVTNHPTGLRSVKLTPVLKMRGIDEPDVLLALAGNFGTPPRGKLFAMGDPSALINEMLRYPGNRAFAIGLLHYLAEDTGGASRGGKVVILANHYSESGAFAGIGTFQNEIENRLKDAEHELERVFQGGLSGVVGLSLAAFFALGVGVWITSVSSRIYRRKVPSFARPVPTVAQGGIAGRAAVLSTSPMLAILELKSALEEGMAQELGFTSAVPTPVLLDEIKKRRALDDHGQQALKRLLLEMATVETTVLARQPGTVGREDVVRIARVVSGLVASARERRALRERAA